MDATAAMREDVYESEVGEMKMRDDFRENEERG